MAEDGGERSIGVDELERLLDDAGERHHRAYEESDGADPEWPLWYATDVQARLWDRGGRLPTRSELVYLLVAAERAYRTSDGSEPWARAYARAILQALAAEP
jgi:NAD(P)H-hydrate epimerase